MAMTRSPSLIYRISNSGSDVPVLPKTGSKEPIKPSLGRTSAELPRSNG